mgnify:CR=1 FL=1
MGVIKPTLTLTANTRSATTDAGPLSVALSLSATDSLTITKVAEAGTASVTTTHTDNLIFDASAMNEVYIYLNNVSDSTVMLEPTLTDLWLLELESLHGFLGLQLVLVQQQIYI